MLINSFLSKFIKWVESQNSICGVILVGSYARGNPKPDSDVDLVILVDDVSIWFEDVSWACGFGKVDKHASEDWGPLKSLRCFYNNGLEVEFGFTSLSWANTDPVDCGTLDVIRSGAKVIYDPKSIFKNLLGIASLI